MAANVLITVGDACAAERAKDYSGFNACPYFVSQQECTYSAFSYLMKHLIHFKWLTLHLLLKEIYIKEI